jgi:hypothetical protein
MKGRIKAGEGSLIGNAGEHYVMAELLKRGIVAALALAMHLVSTFSRPAANRLYGSGSKQNRRTTTRGNGIRRTMAPSSRT